MLHLRDALKVLFHGLPKPTVKTEVEVVTDRLVIPENAEFTQVYVAKATTSPRWGTRSLDWDGAYFRTCKEAFRVSNGAATVSVVSAYVRGNTALTGGFSSHEFYTPPEAFEGAGAPVP